MPLSEPIVALSLAVALGWLVAMNKTKKQQTVSDFTAASDPSNFAHNLDFGVNAWHHPGGQATRHFPRSTDAQNF
jgi:hypothetical protein